MRRAVVAVLTSLLLVAMPGAVHAEPMDGEIVCVVQVKPGGQWGTYACVDTSLYEPPSHVIVCPPVVKLPDGTYYCVTGPFPF